MPAGDASSPINVWSASSDDDGRFSGAVRTRISRLVSDSVRWLRVDRTDRADRAVAIGSSSTWAARSNAATSSAKAARSAALAAVSRSKRARSAD